MGASSVDKLMRELGVEQLAQIQSSLRQEMEKKREELRQMVGRRYRDVLEASNTVKRLTEIAGELASLLADIRECSSLGRGIHSGDQEQLPFVAKRDAARRMVLFHSLLPMTFTSPDLLTRAFSLTLCEGFHRTLCSEMYHFVLPSSPPKAGVSTGSKENHSLLSLTQLLQILADQLLKFRMELIDEIGASLGAKADWQALAALLAAFALLNPKTTVPDLFQMYFKARMEMIVESLRQPESTLLGIIRNMKETVQCVEQTFGSGEGLASALDCVTARGWCPASVKKFLNDQPLGSSRILETAIGRVNALYPTGQIALPSREVVQENCSKWVVEMCSVASERVRAMSAYFDKVDQIVEFSVAVNHIFKSDWPSAITSNSLIYRQLFADALFQRFHCLIDHELQTMEQQLHTKLSQINCTPPPLFHKRTDKFDPLLASGVSHELNDLVQSVNNSLRQLHQNVVKYTSIGHEENVNTLQDIFADKVLAFAERLTDFNNWKLELHKTMQTSTADVLLGEVDNFSSLAEEHGQQVISLNQQQHLLAIGDCVNRKREERRRWLSLFRLLLALVQHEPSMLCQCMNRSVEKVVLCNRKLHSATEQTLSHFLDFVIDECLLNSNLQSRMLDSCSSWQGWLDLLQEPERVKLGDSAATLEVPTQLSRHFFTFLNNICHEVNQNSLGHLFTRNVTLHVSKRLGSLLSQMLVQYAHSCAPILLICAQLLFDCKTLFLIFPNKCFLDAAQHLEAKIEPIELSVLQEPLARNAKLFQQRTAMLFGQLQAEPVAAFKEGQLLASYSALVDLMPKVGEVHRLTKIPRLSKLREEQQRTTGGREAVATTGQQKRVATLGTAEAMLAADGGGLLPSKGSSTSFTSLYEKISTGWFKS